eukprot:c23424_g1_i1 orf=164-1219(+)
MEVFYDPVKPLSALESQSIVNCSMHAKRWLPAWLGIRVFYVRVSCCSLKCSPEILTLRYFPISVSTSMEMNGVRVSDYRDAFLILKRDRVDKESAEVTYVSTDNLRTSGAFCFTVYDKDDQLICGLCERYDCSDAKIVGDCHGNLDSEQTQSTSFQRMGSQHGWRIECACVMGSSKCSFTRSRPNFSALTCPPPCVEVYLAGRVCGLPVVLTETVKLIAKRNHTRYKTMHTILEDEHAALPYNPTVDRPIQGSEKSELLQRELVDTSTAEQNGFDGSLECEVQDDFYSPYQLSYFHSEEGQLSWFKAGVRVGLGIGLGMCLGLGLGVGIFYRTYQSTAKIFNRKTFLRNFL